MQVLLMHTRRRDSSEKILDHWRSVQPLRRSWKNLSSVSRTYIQDDSTSHDRGCSEGHWRRNHDHGRKTRLFGSLNANQYDSSCRQALSETSSRALYRTHEQGFQILISNFTIWVILIYSMNAYRSQQIAGKTTEQQKKTSKRRQEYCSNYIE